MLICPLNTWILFISESQIRGAGNTKYVLNQYPNNTVNSEACEQSCIVLQGEFIYIDII